MLVLNLNSKFGIEFKISKEDLPKIINHIDGIFKYSITHYKNYDKIVIETNLSNSQQVIDEVVSQAKIIDNDYLD